MPISSSNIPSKNVAINFFHNQYAKDTGTGGKPKMVDRSINDSTTATLATAAFVGAGVCLVVAAFVGGGDFLDGAKDLAILGGGLACLRGCQMLRDRSLVNQAQVEKAGQRV